MIVAALLTLVVAAGSLSVASALPCPSREDLERSLRALNTPPHNGELNIEERNEGLLVQWRGGDHRERQRILPPIEACQERSDAVAVVLAAWWSAPADESLTVAPVPSHAMVARAADRPPANPPSPSVLLFAAGALVSTNERELGAGLRADVLWQHPDRDLGWRWGLDGTWPQENRIGDGRARWNRLSTMVGPSLRLFLGRTVTAEWDAAFVASLWLVRGTGFDSDDRDFTAAPGMSTAPRVTFALGPVSAWVETRAFMWAGTRTLVATDVPSRMTHRRDLVPWEVQLNIGISFSVRP